MENRREFIKKAAFLAGSTGLWSALPDSLRRALKINPEAGSTFFDAEHVVMLMQENRSFDHCFGTLRGVRGFNDPRAITLPNKNLVWMQTENQGHTFAPFRLNMKDSKFTWMGGLPHSWENQVDARNGGKYDKWLDAKRSGNKDYRDMPLTMGYVNRDDIPFYYALADAFTICDQHFCSSLTGTTTNRLFFWSGALKGQGPGQHNVRNSDVYYNKEVSWKTFPERLEENGISWKVYQNELSIQTELEGENEYWLANFTDNNLEWFTQYQVRFSHGHIQFLQKRTAELPQEIAALEASLKTTRINQAQPIKNKLAQKKAQLAKYTEELASYNPSTFEKLPPMQQQLHKKAFTDNRNDPDYHQKTTLSYKEGAEERTMSVPKGDVLHQFREDVRSGQLPTVSWLVAPQAFSDHPSSPWFGAWYVSEVLDILTKNPEVWKKTIFILNYDENDGMFDHIPPFVAPKPGDKDSGAVSDGIDTADEYVTMEEEKARKDLEASEQREGPVGLGYRVPLIIASPWSRGGWVNSEVCDITSTIRFLETFLKKKTGKDLTETNISPWRRTVTGDLSSVFRPYNGEKMQLPEFLQRDVFIQTIFNARFKNLPSGFKALTEEEIAKANQDPVRSGLLPQQEPGVKDSCALPYELSVDGGRVDTSVYLNFQVATRRFGERTAGAAFEVYAPNNYLQTNPEGGKTFLPVKTWSFAVKPGDKLTYRWPIDHFEESKYHLRVYGPNGFFRELKGHAADPMLVVTTIEDILFSNTRSATIRVGLQIKNLADKTLHVVLKDHVYGNKPINRVIHRDEGADLWLPATKSFGWYDFSLFLDGEPLFERRFAGRVETGGPSKTDPFMGRI
ncbi:phospholipase C [bacterium A37T11]|nr:phospholipase C [bacterium A37T11]